jgi:hypothetical protein
MAATDAAAPRIALEDLYARQYAVTGKQAHYTRPFGGPDRVARNTALCGRWTPLGTGTQDEIDKAARLPLCRFCQAKVGG